MVRKAFFSFHYGPDNWRAAQVRQMGVIEGDAPCSDNEWESITRGGENAIKKWILSQLEGKSCLIVLVGSETAGRKWINFEIIEAWKAKKAVFGIHIHSLQNSAKEQAAKGRNPFELLNFGQQRFSSVVQCYDPPFLGSKEVYGYIKDNMSAWIETAIVTRSKY